MNRDHRKEAESRIARQQHKIAGEGRAHRHAQDSGHGVLELEILVVKGRPIDRRLSCSVTVDKVAALAHEIRDLQWSAITSPKRQNPSIKTLGLIVLFVTDHSMECAAFVALHPSFVVLVLAGAKATEVLRCRRNNILEKFHGHSTQVLACKTPQSAKLKLQRGSSALVSCDRSGRELKVNNVINAERHLKDCSTALAACDVCIVDFSEYSWATITAKEVAIVGRKPHHLPPCAMSKNTIGFSGSSCVPASAPAALAGAAPMAAMFVPDGLELLPPSAPLPDLLIPQPMLAVVDFVVFLSKFPFCCCFGTS